MTNSTSSPDSDNRKYHGKAYLTPARIFPGARRAGVRLAAVLFWLLVWQGVSLWIGQDILLVSPVAAARAFVELLGQADFYGTVVNSLLHVAAGFLAGVLTGTALAALACALPPVGTLLKPLMHAIKATPVASFVILALIFIRSQYLSVLMAFLMVMPILYTNVLAGLQGVDRKLMEMARVFRMSMGARIRAIYLPAAYPHFLSACALSLGMSWKSGIAAEVIGLPDRSIGGALYQAKIFFNTPELFAWTLAIILLSVGLERAVLVGVRALSRRLKGERT